MNKTGSHLHMFFFKLNLLSAIYKNFKIIIINYMMSILNSVLLLCFTRQDEQNMIAFVYVLKKIKST
jgi:hypothetical protein